MIEIIKWLTDFSTPFTFRCKLSAPWSTSRTPTTTHKKTDSRIAMFTGHKRTEQESLHVWSFIWKKNHLFCVNGKWNKIRPLCTLAWLALRCIYVRNLILLLHHLPWWGLSTSATQFRTSVEFYNKLSFIMNPCRHLVFCKLLKEKVFY